jgi:protein TonB
MKRAAEFTLFAGLAAFIHVSLFATAPQSGVQSSGAGGDARVSIKAASASLAEMVEAWERPTPRVQLKNPDLTQPQTQPTTPPTTPKMPQFDLAQAPRVAVLVALAEPELKQVVEVDTAPPPPPPPLPPPPPEPEPEPQPKPKPPEKPAPKQPAPKPPAPKPPVAKTSQQTSAGRPAQRAAGSGGGAEAGVAGGASAATTSAGQKAKLQSIWGAKIRSRIERRKRYPSGQRGKGRVVLRITVAASGKLINYRVAKSSGVAGFDQAALKAVSRAGKFPSAPKQLGGKPFTFNLPMSFSR